MPIQYQQKPLTRICEICGKEVLQDYAFSLHVSWVTSGSPLIGSFNCDRETGQHWACSIEHAEEAIIECIQSHLHQMIVDRHEKLNVLA